MYTYPKKYSVIVIGAGHAGGEAGLSCARMGLDTLVLTMNLDSVAQMSCNPAIGGLAKGQIVREIDALGGEMAKNTDKTGLQFRMLNMSKGPAVQSPRAQCDKKLYQWTMKHTLEKQKNLDLKQGEAIKILTQGEKACGILTRTGIIYPAEAVIITTGTFLNGLIHIGEINFPAGRGGEFPSHELSKSITDLGFIIGRLKTGTPPRLNIRTIDFSSLNCQPGDQPPRPFSHFTEKINQTQLPCWVTYTNENTHRIIRENLHRSPLYAGRIKGVGPRYCPSIEDKVVRFADKDRHQIFLEPEGYNTEEIYANGISSSLPEDVQTAFVRTIPGLEKSEILRPGYAIEYDFCPPTQLYPTLETKLIKNLFFAGQINGTTGYEEAAAQGLMAGINAGLKIQGKEELVLDRSQAYIGVLIDDLVTKGTEEPYRMFTSRAEYRLILRSDNADLRLMDLGFKIGLIDEKNYQKFQIYRRRIESQLGNQEKYPIGSLRGVPMFIGTTKQSISPDKIASLLEPAQSGSEGVARNDDIEQKIANEVAIEQKYNGYIRRQFKEIEKFKKLENKKMPADIDYERVVGLLTESRQKLKKILPQSIGQAARISGVTPADIAVLLVHLEKMKYASTRL